MKKETVKTKVLHVLVDGKYSGAQHVAIKIIESTMDCYNSLYVSKEGTVRKVLEEKGIDYTFVNNLSVNSLSRIISEYKPDIIHAHDFSASLISSFVSKGIPVISHIHQNPPWIKGFNYKSIAFMISSKKARRVLVVSDSIVEEYVFKHFIKNKSIIVGNPFSVSEIIEKSKELNAGEGRKNCFDVAFVGRLEEEKNPVFFIEIIHEIKKVIPKISAVIIGEGSKREECEKIIEELDLANEVELMGFLTNPYNVLDRCRMLCVPSKWEGFGLVAVEGMALGKPVICSCSGGLKTIVNDEVGKICNEKDEYVSEIIRLLNDRDYYSSKSQNAIHRAGMYDNTVQYSNEIMNIYNDCIKRE